MDTALKAEFVAELRSGKYVPAKGYLHVVCPDGGTSISLHCPLGVLCDMAAKRGFVNAYLTSVDGETFYEYDDYDTMRYSSMPPYRVYEWAGIDRYEDAQHVARMFDNGATFNEVADYVEAEW